MQPPSDSSGKSSTLAKQRTLEKNAQHLVQLACVHACDSCMCALQCMCTYAILTKLSEIGRSSTMTSHGML